VEDGVYAKPQEIKNLTAKMGMVFQHFNLFPHLTVQQNLEMSPRLLKQESAEAISSRCLDLLKKIGLSEKANAYPANLSGGQKQRLSLARAFLRNSPVLLLDDALSAVDAKTEQAIIENLSNQTITDTLVIVTHRLSAITTADQVLVLDEGQVVQRGTHASLIQEPGWYQDQYYHQQIKEDEASDA